MARPRLVFGSGTSKVKFKNKRLPDDSSIEAEESMLDEDHGRSSMESTAGIGSFIVDGSGATANISSNFTFKVVLLGDPSVGKTCLARLFVQRKVMDKTQNTIGFDHHIKDIIVGGVPISLQLWDTAGMEQFRNALIRQYYRNVDGIILVYDISSHNSFDHIENWLSEAKQYSEHPDRLKLALVGNKSDREAEREVPEEEGRSYANERGLLFMELSAKNDESLDSLDNMITTLSQQMLTSREENSFTRSMSNVIRIEGSGLLDDWVLIDAPEGPIPRSLYQQQDEGVRLRDQLTSSVRDVLNVRHRIGGNQRCKC